MITSSPGWVWDLIASWLAMVPDGTKRVASFPSILATLSWRALTVGSSPKTSSPTSASDIAFLMAGVGRVTVSLLRSIHFFIFHLPRVFVSLRKYNFSPWVSRFVQTLQISCIWSNDEISYLTGRLGFNSCQKGRSFFSPFFFFSPGVQPE